MHKNSPCSNFFTAVQYLFSDGTLKEAYKVKVMGDVDNKIGRMLRRVWITQKQFLNRINFV